MNGVIFFYDGIASFADVGLAKRLIGEHENLVSFKYVIHDFSGVESFFTDDEQLTQLAAYSLGLLYTNGKLRSANVSEHDCIYNAFKKYNTLTKLHCEWFSSLNDAKKWASALRIN